MKSTPASPACRARSRGAPIIEAEMGRALMSTALANVKILRQPNSAMARQFCGEVLRLQAELAASHDRDDLTAARQTKRRAPQALQATGISTEDDPQALVLGNLLGLNTNLARIVLTSWTAVILELQL